MKSEEFHRRIALISSFSFLIAVGRSAVGLSKSTALLLALVLARAMVFSLSLFASDARVTHCGGDERSIAATVRRILPPEGMARGKRSVMESGVLEFWSDGAME